MVERKLCMKLKNLKIGTLTIGALAKEKGAIVR